MYTRKDSVHERDWKSAQNGGRVNGGEDPRSSGAFSSFFTFLRRHSDSHSSHYGGCGTTPPGRSQSYRDFQRPLPCYYSRAVFGRGGKDPLSLLSLEVRAPRNEGWTSVPGHGLLSGGLEGTSHSLTVFTVYVDKTGFLGVSVGSVTGGVGCLDLVSLFFRDASL